jgi:hypothetical protein
VQLVEEEVDDETGLVIRALTFEEQKSLCVGTLGWLANFFESVNCIAFVYSDPNSLKREDYNKSANVLKVTV